MKRTLRRARATGILVLPIPIGGISIFCLFHFLGIVFGIIGTVIVLIILVIVYILIFVLAVGQALVISITGERDR